MRLGKKLKKFLANPQKGQVSKMADTRLSVVMSVYNGGDFIQESVDSLLTQTIKDFEIIIIDDGSTDDTAKILKSYKDPRIKIFHQNNQGLVKSLNRGISLAAGKYIARQDADDKSEPDRLERQLACLEDNPAVVVVGSSIRIMDEKSRIKHVHHVLLNNPELKQELLVRSPFAHGSVMFNKDAFVKAGGYLENEWPAEDYGLWLRISIEGDFANLDAPLYVYRESSGSISSRNSALQEQKKRDIQAKAWLQRRRLQSKKIDTTAYQELEMGQQRIERIAHNLIFVLRKSLRKLHLFAAIRTKLLLLMDKGLRRKWFRLIAIKLRLKDG
jgi:glycosyltransferase involved in cell wall biosynthesis